MSTQVADVIDHAGLSEGVFADVDPYFNSKALPQSARDLYDDRKAAIRDHVAAGEQGRSDLAELSRRKDLLPAAGYERLVNEAKEEARLKQLDADTRWKHLAGEHEEVLIDDALPTYDAARETLARQELGMALGDASGDVLSERVLAVVQSGSREAVAVLLRDPFGTTLLESRGLTGRALSDTLAMARRTAASLAAERGANERERAAGAALRQLTILNAARGAAGWS